jgi:bla regulator protein blaR1
MVVLSAALMAPAHQTEAPLRFAAASLKPNTTIRNGMGNKFDPGMARWTNTPLANLIQEAFHLKGYQTAGWSEWLHADKWDIDAKTKGPTTSAQKHQMLQTLIIERFGLKYHSETRDISGYELAIAKGGPKIHPVTEDPPNAPRAGITILVGSIESVRNDWFNFVYFLSDALGRPLHDGTGLAGKFTFKLQWVPDESQPNSFGEAPPPDAPGPSIFAAMQDQLGLKLEPKKFPVEMFVIDHLNRIPTGN